MNRNSRLSVRRSTGQFFSILVAGMLLILASPAWSHDPGAVKNADEVQLPDLELLKNEHGDLLIGIGDKCLDVQGADPSDGVFVNIFECHGQENQRWELEPVSSFFELRGLEGKCVQPGGGESGVRLIIGPCGGLEDRWEPDPDVLSDFSLVHVSSGKCMDVEGASSADRTPVNIFDCHGGPNQTWRLGQDTPAGLIEEVEPNDSHGAAQYLDPGDFTRTFDADIGNTTHNTSVSMSHVTVLGTGDETFDYYSFTVENAGDIGIFDIDYATMDAYLRLYDSQGSWLAANDDSPTSWGAGGSVSGLDSYLEYTFSQPGLYVIRVGRCCGSSPVPDGASYKLQVSLGQETAILLRQERFAVTVDWRTDDGSGPGRPSHLRTDDSGIFYFFSPNNLELLLKVVDGCAFNDRYWVFFAATTDVEFTVTVTDLLNGISKIYTNPPHHPADAVTDVGAFDTCP